MNISGVLVHTLPGKEAIVREELIALSGVEVHRDAGDGRLIVTIEEDEGARAGDTLLAVHRVKGVVAAALVYHHFEPDDPDDPENPDQPAPSNQTDQPDQQETRHATESA